MKSFTKNILATGMAIIAYTFAFAQQGATTSDISITSISLSAAGPVKKTAAVSNNTNPGNRPVTLTPSDDILKCTITVHNDNSGQTRMTTLVVTLPVDVTIVSNPFNAVVSKTGDQKRWGMPGCMVFDLFNMSPGSDKTIEFTFTKSVNGNKVGAYVYSACPDPDPTNNYKNASY
jgi:Domain of unknown function DUF11